MSQIDTSILRLAMKNGLQNRAFRRLRSMRAASGIEYAAIVGLIAVLAIGAVLTVGGGHLGRVR
jgi:Flp pilus assembly pilin Flp